MNDNENTYGYLMNLGKLSKLLIQARDVSGKTQIETAKIIQVSRRTLQRVELKENNFRSEYDEKRTIEWINKILGTNHKTER